ATMIAHSIDTAGFWTRLGHRIDANKDRAGIFTKKGMRDVFALASLVPGLKQFMKALNERMPDVRNSSLPADRYVVGGAHIDGSKYITALTGRRDNLETQILRAENWISLPVTEDNLSIFPSAKMSSLSRISATQHRVLLSKRSDEQRGATRNITLSLS